MIGQKPRVKGVAKVSGKVKLPGPKKPVVPHAPSNSALIKELSRGKL